ncbi:YbfB/YjiJ family MFS transporter, partial [Mitsuaria sp. TWR114]
MGCRSTAPSRGSPRPNTRRQTDEVLDRHATLDSRCRHVRHDGGDVAGGGLAHPQPARGRAGDPGETAATLRAGAALARPHRGQREPRAGRAGGQRQRRRRCDEGRHRQDHRDDQRDPEATRGPGRGRRRQGRDGADRRTAPGLHRHPQRGEQAQGRRRCERRAPGAAAEGRARHRAVPGRAAGLRHAAAAALGGAARGRGGRAHAHRVGRGGADDADRWPAGPGHRLLRAHDLGAAEVADGRGRAHRRGRPVPCRPRLQPRRDRRRAARAGGDEELAAQGDPRGAGQRRRHADGEPGDRQRQPGPEPPHRADSLQPAACGVLAGAADRHGAAERRQRAHRQPAGRQRGRGGRARRHGGRRGGGHDGADRCLGQEDQRHHRHHRRHRLPDQHPGAERRGGSGARRRARQGFRGGGVGGPGAGAAQRRRGARDQGADRRQRGQGRGRLATGARCRRHDDGDRRQRAAGVGHHRRDQREHRRAEPGHRQCQRLGGAAGPDDAAECRPGRGVRRRGRVAQRPGAQTHGAGRALQGQRPQAGVGRRGGRDAATSTGADISADAEASSRRLDGEADDHAAGGSQARGRAPLAAQGACRLGRQGKTRPRGAVHAQAGAGSSPQPQRHVRARRRLGDVLIRPWQVSAGGIAGLILSIGLARFAYTPLLPLMQQQAGLSDAMGGTLAAVNYAGYMSGAVIAALIDDPRWRSRLYLWGMVLGLLATALMPLAPSLPLWALSRYLGGLSGAAGMLLGSGLVLGFLMRAGKRPELGVHFLGLGLGIVVSALGAMAMDRLALDWAGHWWGFVVVGLPLLALTAWWRPPVPPPVAATSTAAAPDPRWMRWMIAGYFCAGWGFVISATFTVAIVERQPLLHGQGPWAWLLVGLAA